MQSLTDVWSAIRNSAYTQLTHLLDHIQLSHAHLLFESFAKVCFSNKNSIHADNSMLDLPRPGHHVAGQGRIASRYCVRIDCLYVFTSQGITAIIRQFQWITNVKPESRKEHVAPHRFSRSDSFEDRSEFVLMVRNLSVRFLSLTT